MLGSKLEDALNFCAIGRQPQFLGRWKTIFIMWQQGRRPQYLGKRKTTYNIWQNGRNPMFYVKWKMTIIILQL
jgi:hypothetical protein